MRIRVICIKFNNTNSNSSHPKRTPTASAPVSKTPRSKKCASCVISQAATTTKAQWRIETRRHATTSTLPLSSRKESTIYSSRAHKHSKARSRISKGRIAIKETWIENIISTVAPAQVIRRGDNPIAHPERRYRGQTTNGAEYFRRQG